MHYIGQQLILRMHLEGVCLCDDICIPYYDVQVGYNGKYSPHQDLMWRQAEVVDFSEGTLECRIGEHQPDRLNSFFSQDADDGAVSKLILRGGSVLEKLTGGSLPIPDWGLSRIRKSVPAPTTERRKPDPRAVPQPVRRFDPQPKSAEPTEYPIRTFQKEYTYRFHEMRIVAGAAIFKKSFTIPDFYRTIDLELRVENEFLEGGYEYIKPYLENRIGKHKLTVSAVIRTQGDQIVSTEATATVVDEITPELIGGFKYWQIRRKLRSAETDEDLVTVDDLFDDAKDSGLKPTDEEFVEDLLAVKKPKHADTVRYLSKLDLYDLMRLRMMKKPFAFLFLVSGEKGCFLILETLNSKEASYIWRLNAPESELRANRDLLQREYTWVEKEISIISAENRKPYRKDSHENFEWIRHEYEKPDGFELWKQRLHQVLDGDGE